MPAEIRQRIWRAALVRVEPVYIYGDGNWSAARSGQLLKTCRQIYDEALPLLYGENLFAYNFGLIERSPPTKNHFGSNIKLIKMATTWVTLSPVHTYLLRQHTGLEKLTVRLCAPAPHPTNDENNLPELCCAVRSLDSCSRGPFLPELRYLHDSLKLDVLDFNCRFQSPGVSFWRIVSMTQTQFSLSYVAQIPLISTWNTHLVITQLTLVN